MTIEFGFTLPQHADWETNLAFAQMCDRAGIDQILAIDHLIDPPNAQRYLHEAWTLIAALASVTERVRLGHIVLCNLFRHPAVLAKMGATLDNISNGRFDLCIGAGYFVPEFEQYGIDLPPIGPRLRMLREAVQVCKALWTESPASFAGEYYRLEDAYCIPPPVQRPHPRILIAGSGEKVLLRIVAEHADMWNNSSMHLDAVQDKIAVLHRHCEALGRDPAEIKVAQMVTLLVAETEAAAARMVEEAQAEGFWGDAIVGTPVQVIERLHELVAQGVDVFQFGTRPDVPVEMVQLFAEEVMPAFRGT